MAQTTGSTRSDGKSFSIHFEDHAFFVRIIGTVAALFIASGCYTNHVRTPVSDAHLVQDHLLFETVGIFDYEKTEVPFSNHVSGLGATSKYELRMLEIPSIGENGQDDNLISARFFQSTLPGAHPLVIVMPIWGSYTYPSRKISSSVQRKSDGQIHVLEMLGENYLIDWSGILAVPDEESYLEMWRTGAEHERITGIDVRRLIDWAEQRPEIDGSRVALIGFSHGAMIGATIVTQEPRLAASVLIMGGAHTHSIIARCDGVRATSVQEKAKADFGWSQEGLEKAIEPIFSPLDPAAYPGRVDPSRVLIIDSGRDTCVPESSRDDLWEAMGRPERITLNYGHKKAFLSITPLGLNWMRRRIWDFLEAKLLTE